MKKYKPAQPITLQQLKDALEKATPEQLAMPARWWGDDRGGLINEVWQLDEDYALTDEGFAPVSTIEPDDDNEPTVVALPKGSFILRTDEMDDDTDPESLN